MLEFNVWLDEGRNSKGSQFQLTSVCKRATNLHTSGTTRFPVLIQIVPVNQVSSLNQKLNLLVLARYAEDARTQK